MLNENVVRRAVQIIKKQASTPQSPGYLTVNGEVNYCAAAALAAAGLELAGKNQRLLDFNQEIISTRSSDCIQQIFEELNWPQEICSSTVLRNDSYPVSIRTENVINYLNSITLN